MNFTIKTTFDLSENLVFAALDENDNPAGVLRVSDGKIMYAENDGTKHPFGDDVAEFEDFVQEHNLHFNRPSVVDSKWVKYQPNPKQYKTGDCTIRAYTKAENLSWEDAYDMAASAGMEAAALPDDNKVVELMMVERFKYTKTRLKKDERITVNEFCIANPVGTYVLKMRGHLVAVVDGLFYDSWDCGNKKITEYYSK